MTESWDEYADGWDQDSDVLSYANKALASLLEHIEVRDAKWKDKRVLDFGCGTGHLTQRLSPFVKEIVAIDTSQKMIDVLCKKQIPNVTAIYGDIENKNFFDSITKNSKFDLIVASSVCSFLPDYEHTLSTLSQALSPKGHFVQWDWLASADDDGLTLDRVTRAFHKENLDPIHVGDAFAFETPDQNMPVLVGVARLSG